ncbi:MAG: hemerythrin domain-containing protein [Proteobacteria bacterium]|nr:hemerythrin domain-containing protein [Pseudomonadota bacterium]MBU1687697.1 hemerythrin domain-containing protein [Pseudomonadota bacterium]
MLQINVFKNMQNQHKDILGLAAKIKAQAGDPSSAVDPDAIRANLSKFRLQLELHLKLEDEILYPLLAKNNKEQIRNTATAFAREFGSVLKAFLDYEEKWSTTGAITQDREGFASETEHFFTVLQARITREDTELFTLIESGSAR